MALAPSAPDLLKELNVEEKTPAVKSKTIWTGALGILVGILAMPQVTGMIPPDALPYVVQAQGVLMIILRLMTGNPIGKN